MPGDDQHDKEHPAGDLTASGAPDVGQFDGSADPNPGGRMGMGWHLTLRDGQEYSGASEAPAALGNTNNQAEYLALLALLDHYAKTGGRGPLLVRGDSQLVILQMNGSWQVRHPALQALHQRARLAVGRIPDGVRFEWVPRHLNATADRLASGHSAETPVSPETLIYAQAPLAGLSPQLTARIATLNGRGSASFKECMALRVGGKDRCSQMRWSDLVAAAGADCVRACVEAFPNDQRSQATALRWSLRGLALQLAIQKVKADQQVMAARSAAQQERRL
jgi:ribonuclease HI